MLAYTIVHILHLPLKEMQALLFDTTQQLDLSVL